MAKPVGQRLDAVERAALLANMLSLRETQTETRAAKSVRKQSKIGFFGFHEAADLMDDMMQLASRGMTRLPMSLCAEAVSCPGPPTREEEEEEEEEEEQEQEEEQEEEQEQEATASPQAADPDPGSIWDVQGDPVDPTRRIRCRR